MEIKKKSVDDWLDEVNYTFLNSSAYVPTEFALQFVNFIKLVNGSDGESNKTPTMHLKMLDALVQPKENIVNLCFRGASKTSLLVEYLSLYLGVFGEIPKFGKVEGMLYITDSMENGAKSARKNIQYRYENSAFLQKWIPKATFTDGYIEFTNVSGKKLGLKLYGAKALALDTVLYLANGGVTTIGACAVGDSIVGADGQPTLITQKSEVFHKPMYDLLLEDGRCLQVSEDHLNQVHIKKFASAKTFSSFTLEEKTLTTLELLEEQLSVQDPNGSNRPLLWVENIQPMVLPYNENLLIDPYTVGVLLGDGSMNGKTTGQVPVVLTAHKDDWLTYETVLPYPLGKAYTDKRNPNVVYRTIIGINQFVSAHGLSTHGDDKSIPEDYLFGSIEQRLALLQGLMDTDGTCTADGKASFSSNSKLLVEGVMWLVRSLGGTARWVSTGKPTHYKTMLRVNMPMFKLKRKLDRQRPLKNNMVAIQSIKRSADQASQCIAVDNAERQFVAGSSLVRTHNTGLRGTKIFGKRPVLAVLDDLISDDDARSPTVLAAVKDTIYRGVNHALDPGKRKIIMSGTPFNVSDPMIEAVESGTWEVNVYPVCENFPCDKADFQPAWEDRFTYEYVLSQYELAVSVGQVDGFYQELMLRISTADNRLVEDHDLRWYDRDVLLKNKDRFNFYITTDFATSSKKGADYSVISVWAYNSNGDWMWVDGVCTRQTMDKNINDLFRLVQEYKPQAVGVEVSGQQGGFIQWIQNEMLNRNTWFVLANTPGTSQAGIRPVGDKLTRFNMVVPWFKLGKIHFPLQWKNSSIIGIFLGQLRMVTVHGIKGKDDCIDTISMLAMLNPWKPFYDAPSTSQGSEVYDHDRPHTSNSNFDSYIV